LSDVSWEQRLREAGYRLTPARRAVLALLSRAEGPLPPGEVLRRARALCPGLGRATVYRTLSLLVRLGLARAVPGPGGLHYVRAEEGVHRLVCQGCGAELVLELCLAGGLAEELARRYGFSIRGHVLEFYGLCPDCQKGE